MSGEKTHVFITGGTGYVGSRLIPVLQRQGCTVRALVRTGSERKLPPGCEVVVGNPLDRSTFEDAIEPYSAFVQLVGVPHPSPAKAQQFYDVDLVSARASIAAAAARQVDHFVYVSVAQPAPIMKAYQLSRAIAEGHLAQSGLTCSVSSFFQPPECNRIAPVSGSRRPRRSSASTKYCHTMKVNPKSTGGCPRVAARYDSSPSRLSATASRSA